MLELNGLRRFLRHAGHGKGHANGQDAVNQNSFYIVGLLRARNGYLRTKRRSPSDDVPW